MTTTWYSGLAADDLGETGARPPLVLLHGLSFDRRTWGPALTELATIDPGRRVLALDLPGHGESEDAPPYAMQAVLERVHSAIGDAGLERPVVVGHSYSAGLVALYAAYHPTSGVIAVEGTQRVGEFAGMAQSLEPALRGSAFSEAWARIAEHEFRLEDVSPEVRVVVEASSRPRQEIVLGYWQDLFSRRPQELDGFVVQGTAAVRRTGVPYVAVAGREPSAAEAAWVEANLPETRTLVWPGSGHFPHLAHPRRFAELLAETRHWARSPEGAFSLR
jgi:pimeloyl-ACP methyl ester carboxylesterase